MAFEKGNKLGKGNKGAKLIEEAIRRAIAQDNGERLRRGVEKLLDLVAAGELAALQVVADRVDGRPAQSVEMNVTRDTRDYSMEELLERLAAFRGGDSSRTDPAQTSAAKPSELH